MASTLIEIPANTWGEIPIKEGSIHHKDGNGRALFVEAVSAPAFNTDTPTMKTTSKGDDFQVFGVADTDSIWCYALNERAEIVYSPRG